MSKKEQILNLLRYNKNGITNVQLSKTSLRYGGYLGQLYKEGYDIKTIPLKKGVFLYVLIKEPEEIAQHMSAKEKLFSEIEKNGSINAAALKNLMDKNNITIKYKANTYKAA
ncbi:hypothetical protein [Rummeliibacillus pycnus]|uniref:hypothetical protein n=1 Tax=Rummeliibacillus pycnus TaxID=101070 RepID=UPI000C9D00D7|nr:hypothetical protein [Rummeliibacillus pycnus]